MNVHALQRFDATITRLGIVLAPDGSPNEVEGVLNPASARTRDGTLLLYPRAVGRANTSRIGIARAIERGSDVRFERLGYALEPLAPYEIRPANHGGMGCEDPRVTFIAALDRYLMAYTAFGPLGPRIAVAVSPDGMAWERLGLADFSAPGLPNGDDKDGVFFPEPVRSPSGVLSIAFYHRPMLRLSTTHGQASVPTILSLPPENRESIRIAYVPLGPVYNDIRNIVKVAETALVLTPDAPWGQIKTGAGTPPVRIDEGWVSFYHAVDAVEVGGKYHMAYSAGIVVHDINEPHIVLYRSPAAVLRPEGADEMHGTVNNVVFPTAIDQRAARTFDVYYGMADSKIGRAACALAPAYAAVADETAA